MLPLTLESQHLWHVYIPNLEFTDPVPLPRLADVALSSADEEEACFSSSSDVLGAAGCICFR